MESREERRRVGRGEAPRVGGDNLRVRRSVGTVLLGGRSPSIPGIPVDVARGASHGAFGASRPPGGDFAGPEVRIP